MTEQRAPRHAARGASPAQTRSDDEPLSAEQARDVLSRLPVVDDDTTEPEPDPTAQRLRRLLYWIAGFLALGAIVVAVLAVYVLTTAIDVAELKSDGAVSANRVKAVGEVRGYPGMPCPDPLAYNADTLTLECANRFVVAAGGEPVPDPGGEVTPTQMGAAVARALSRFDRALERREGEARPGVSSPTTGRFRGAG